MRPKISVIIPCFNSSKTILRTLDSLERQTFQEFEVILIDDGSQDNTLQCVQDYRSHSSLQINTCILKKILACLTQEIKESKVRMPTG